MTDGRAGRAGREPSLPPPPARTVARRLAPSAAVLVLLAVAVVTVLMSQFGTVRGGATELGTLDDPVGGEGTGALDAPWSAVRGDWARAGGAAVVTDAGDRLSVAVRPVGGVDGTVAVDGPADVDGWSVVWRWEGPGSYGLAVVEPSEGTVSLVAVVSDRTRLLGQARLPSPPVGSVEVELDGPVVRARIDGEVVVAGREDDLVDGTHAGVAVVGDADGARFTRLRTRPPGSATVRTVEPEAGP